jgi:hypothetical protein
MEGLAWYWNKGTESVFYRIDYEDIGSGVPAIAE